MANHQPLRAKVAVAVAVDHAFKDYLLEFWPAHMPAVIARLPELPGAKGETLLHLVRSIDAIVPASPRRGKPGHTYMIGRQVGRRILYLRLRSGHLPKNFYPDFKALNSFAKEAGALGDAFSDKASWWISFLWI